MKKGIYRHFKGGMYELIDVAVNSETLEDMAIYRALYGERKTWARPLSMWEEEVTVNGETVKRFEYIDRSNGGKLLIVVDYQNDFVDGTLGFEGAEKFEDIICQKIKETREMGGDVIFTFDCHGEEYFDTEEGRNLPIAHCIKGTKGFELYGKVADMIEDGDVTFAKPAFGSFEMGEYLEYRAYSDVEICGLVSNICVLSNAVIAKASLKNAHIVVDARATGSASPEMDEKNFDILEGIHIEVINRQER